MNRINNVNTVIIEVLDLVKNNMYMYRDVNARKIIVVFLLLKI